MKLLILRTNIATQTHIERLQSMLNSFSVITRWSVDMEDIDKVLKIEAKDQANELELIQAIREKGFFCEDLPDGLPV